MNYTLHQLHIFLTISQTKSVTKAAEQLNLSQPAVSIQLKKFQEQFDLPLTELLGRKIHITNFGREVAEAAENILNLANAIHYKSVLSDAHLVGRLKIAVVSTGKYVMPYFLTHFLKQHPGVDLVMDVNNKGNVVASLENNEVDFALVSIVPKSLNVEHFPLLENKLYMVTKEMHEKIDQTRLKEELTDLPFIFREKGSGTYQIMKDFLNEHKIKVKNHIEVKSNDAVKQALIAGMGYSIMPLVGLKNELQTKALHIVNVAGFPIKTEWQLVWLKGKKHTPVATEYLDHLQINYKNIIDTNFSWYTKH